MPSIRRHRILLIPVVGLFLFFAAGTPFLYAIEQSLQGKPALPGEDCQTKPLKAWTPQEKWVWDQVCRGKAANFNKVEDYGGDLDPKEDKEWPRERILSPTFLETILLHEPYRGALTHHGVHIVGAWFEESLDLSNTHLSCQLWLQKSRFESDVSLNFLKTHRTLVLIGSTFTGELNMNGLEVGQSLLMDGGAKFAEVDLCSAKIGGQIAMIGSTFTGKLNMDSIEVGQSLLMHEGAKFAEVVLRSAKIGNRLDLSGSTFATINLTGTLVSGEFALGPPATRWLGGGKLTLRNTNVGALRYCTNAWPDTLELDGFTYACLSGFASDGANSIATRDVSRLKEWLKRQKSYTPQPYEQLASVLREEGHKDKAVDVLYAGRNRELSETKSISNWLGLFLLKIFIGYGHRIYYAFFWLLGFIAFGVVVLKVSGQGPAHGMRYGVAFSLDMLLPIIRLRELHYKFDLAGWARYYYYFHKLMGYVLVLFLVAGLSGLTK